MKKIISLLFILAVVVSCKAGSGEKKIETTADSTNVAIKSFEELVEAVPITELPFGVLGIDTIWTYPANTGLPKLPYDSLNVYGLNNYFQKHPETLGEVTSEGSHDESTIPIDREKFVDFYFVARLPAYKGLESLVYYFQEVKIVDGVKKYYDRWVWICCKDSGIVRYYDIIAQNGEPDVDWFFLIRIEKNYKETRRYYDAPRSDVNLFYDNSQLAGEMKDEYDTPNRLILTSIFKNDKYVKYVWINNTPIEYKINDTPDDVHNRYNTLMEGRKAK